MKNLSLLLISLIALLPSCTTVQNTSSDFGPSTWKGLLKNLTYGGTANFEVNFNSYDSTSGSITGSALITGKLVGSGQLHGQIKAGKVNFTIIPESGIGSEIICSGRLEGNSMRGKYNIPAHARSKKQKGIFQITRIGGLSPSTSMDSRIKNRAQQEIDSWNYQRGFTRNTVRVTSSPSGARVEVDGDYKGKTPLYVEIIGSKSRRLTKPVLIKTYPVYSGGYTQKKYLPRGNKVPENLYFDMSLVPAKRRPSVQINVN